MSADHDPSQRGRGDYQFSSPGWKELWINLLDHVAHLKRAVTRQEDGLSIVNDTEYQTRFTESVQLGRDIIQADREHRQIFGDVSETGEE